jgi:hypothetical protein
MLEIAKHQMDSLGQSRLKRFIDAELSRLKSRKDINPELLESLDESWGMAGHEAAKGYGLVTEAEHSRFNDLRLVRGPEFPDPEESSILQESELSAPQKLDELEGRWVISMRS